MKKAHIIYAGGRTPCRYSARPSRSVRALSVQAFADTPVAMRCVECDAKYRAVCAELAAKATGSA